MKSFLAEARRKQKQEAAASDFSLQLYFCWVIVSQRMADIKTISARSLRREPVEERLSPGEAVRFSKRGGKKFELRRVDTERRDFNAAIDAILKEIPTVGPRVKTDFAKILSEERE
jgi:hypothetical protein